MVIRSLARADVVFKLLLETSLSEISFQAQTLPVRQATAFDSSRDTRVFDTDKLGMISAVGKLHPTAEVCVSVCVLSPVVWREVDFLVTV